MNEVATFTFSAENLTLTRGYRALFSNLALQISAGQALVLRGPNGSGKTSLLRVLAGLTEADAGAMHGDEYPWQPQAHAVYLGHANALKDDFTAAENLADGLVFDGVAASEEAQYHALDRVGLLSRRHLLARRLSQGQKRRIGLARLILSTKPLWLLDEPTNALDREGVVLFTEIVDAHLQRGGMACIATHLTMSLSAHVNELMLVGAA